MNEELELKFGFEDASALERWLDGAFPVTDEHPWQTIQIVDRYFDTADFALRAAGYACRLRTSQGETLLTVKANIEIEGGWHRRLELEAPAARTLDTRRWPESEGRTRIMDLVGQQRLVERFVFGQQRRERHVLIDDLVASVSIDQGEVEYLALPAGEIHQLEVELVSGSEATLRAVGARIAASGLAVPQERSKLGLAAELVEHAARVGADDKWSDAARKMLRRHLVRMLEREPATRAGHALALKQMRVATRRMRATWSAFVGAFVGGQARRFDVGLRRVARMLGEVRDVDVLIDGIADRDDLNAFRDDLHARRDIAFSALINYLDGGAYERFVDEFLAGTAARARWTPGRKGRDRVTEHAPGRVANASARVVEAAAAARDSNEATAWHTLRIAAKRLRYTLEAFRDVLDERATTELIERLRTAQDVLGEMNDASLAGQAAAAWLAEGAAGADAAPEVRMAVARFIAECEQRVAQYRIDFEQLWPALQPTPLPAIPASEVVHQGAEAQPEPGVDPGPGTDVAPDPNADPDTDAEPQPDAEPDADVLRASGPDSGC